MAKKAKQLMIMMDDRVGLLADLTAALAAAKVNVGAVCAYGMEGKANFMLLTDDTVKAKKIGKSMGGEVSVEDVITVELPNKRGELEKVAKKIADAGVSIYYIYGTAGACRNPLCVIKTNDDKKALKALAK